VAPILRCALGERVAIIGPNGAGKSTLFNLISGRFGATSGEILLHGERIDGLTPFQINRRGLSRSFQVSNLFTRLSVFENIRCAVLWSMGYRYAFWKFLVGMRDANDRAEEVLEMIKLDRRRDHAGDEPHLCRTARTRDRHHHCRCVLECGAA
jgi:branched-chain amino acid transport system ATP-binding protein